jgi:hypothetical protein
MWIVTKIIKLPWSRDLLEKLTVTQIVKNFPAFRVTRRFSAVFTTVRHWSLSWTRRIQSTSFHCFPMVHSNIFLPMPRPSAWSVAAYTSPLRLILFSVSLHNTHSTYLYFAFRRSIQGIRVTFHNKLWGFLSPSPNPQAGGSPLFGCPRLFIQYIRSYPPHLEAGSFICNQRTRHGGMTDTWHGYH